MKRTCGGTRLESRIEKDEKCFIQNLTRRKNFFQNLTRCIFFKSKPDASCFFFSSKSDRQRKFLNKIMLFKKARGKKNMSF